jgi:hypothetical protein
VWTKLAEWATLTETWNNADLKELDVEELQHTVNDFFKAAHQVAR